MAIEEKEREEAYWHEFSTAGVLPAAPASILEEKGVDYVRGLLSGKYNELTKLLLAEALVARGELTEADAGAQVAAAKWVRLKTLSKKSNYMLRDQMLASLMSFMEASGNPQLVLVGGLLKAAAKVQSLALTGKDTVSYAQSCLARLAAVASEHPSYVGLDAFCQLVVSIGWEFVKHHEFDALGRTLSLIPAGTPLDAFQADQLAKLRERLEQAPLQPLRDWPAKAKEVYHGLPGSAVQVQPLMQELFSQAHAFGALRQQEDLRNFILFWVAALLGKVRKTGNGLSAGLGGLFLQVAQADGLQDLPDACWERKRIDPPPAQGDGIFPATAEKLLNGLYGIVMDRYKREPPQDDASKAVVRWLIERMSEVYARLPDEKWGDFRLGKLAILLGQAEKAKQLLLPAVRRNQSQFWAWDALGQLFPEHRSTCLARALLCGGEEIMLSRVKREAVESGLPVDDQDALRAIAQDANELLLDGMPFEKGVLEARYVNKEGKDRVRFILEGEDPQHTPRPVSPGALRLPRSMKEGAPVRVYLDEVDPTRIVSVRIREDGTPWDVLPQANVVFYGRSRKGNAQLASAKDEMTTRSDRFPALQNARPGDAFTVRYTVRLTDYGKAYDIRDLRPAATPQDLISAYEGELRLPNGVGAAGFVDNVYIPPELIHALLDRGITGGTPVCGRAVRLPPRQETDHFGRVRTKVRRTALTLDILGGEALERYRYQHPTLAR